MDEDKLKLLRRERDARRPRGRDVEGAWKSIAGEDGLSTKEKLERLIRLTGDKYPKPKAPEVEAPPRPAKLLDPFRVVENPYRTETLYGQIRLDLGLQIPGDILACLGRDPGFEALDLSTALFIDLETTGLAGGTGTVPFLVGLGYYRDDRFRVVQYFLNDLAGEGRMLDDLVRFFETMGFTSVVSYNGKAFDLPLLETRFILHRKPFRLAALPHLDFLFSARSLWQHRYDSCRLFTLAQEIVRAPRDEDIPSAEIPERYFYFLRTGDFSMIEPILYHNQEDILSLLSVMVAGSVLVSRNRDALGPAAPAAGAIAGGPSALAPRPDEDVRDLFGVARVLERAGDGSRSAALLEKAIQGGLRGEASETARKKLSRHFKKSKDYGKALSLWQGEGGQDSLFGLRELAMHFEHHEGNLEEAIRVAEEGLALSMERGSTAGRRDFEKRLERLRKKLRKAGPIR